MQIEKVCRVSYCVPCNSLSRTKSAYIAGSCVLHALINPPIIYANLKASTETRIFIGLY